MIIILLFSPFHSYFLFLSLFLDLLLSRACSLFSPSLPLYYHPYFAYSVFSSHPFVLIPSPYSPIFRYLPHPCFSSVVLFFPSLFMLTPFSLFPYSCFFSGCSFFPSYPLLFLSFRLHSFSLILASFWLLVLLFLSFRITPFCSYSFFLKHFLSCSPSFFLSSLSPPPLLLTLAPFPGWFLS